MGGNYREYLELAEERLSAAESLIEKTYPVLQKPKLLLNGLQHIFLSMNYSMNAILAHEFAHKTSIIFSTNFSGRFAAFRIYAEKYGFKTPMLLDLRTIRQILLEHKKSPVEFARNGKFVICSNNYDLKVISKSDIHRYLQSATEFFYTARNCARSKSYLISN